MDSAVLTDAAEVGGAQAAAEVAGAPGITEASVRAGTRSGDSLATAGFGTAAEGAGAFGVGTVFPAEGETAG